ncbi:MAG: SRPBCC family protein [Leptolyngbyaceae cyanobacterium MO_188.B28]|nr:SRPBCC family protein [Leptolyngbyaceae cyanobacterium MO_188.B28]
MQIKQQFTINVSADKVWEILGRQYAQVSEWASAVHASQERNSGVIPQNAPCSGRICETDLGGFKETITQYDERGKVVSYTAQGDKMPFFVKNLANTWKVTPLGKDQSRVDMCMEISILPVFNLVMGPMMRMQMGGVSKKVTEELQHFAEKGVPHPRKLAAQQKYRLKLA